MGKSRAEFGYPITDWQDESAYPDPKKMNGPELAWEYIRRNPKYQMDFKRWRKATSVRTRLGLVNKWFRGERGISKMLDPKIGKPRGLKLRLKCRPTIIELEASGPTNLMVSPFHYKNDIVAVFNLNQTIDPQIKSVKEHLTKEQKIRKIKPIKSSPKRQPQKIYWRILDARASGIELKKISRILFNLEEDDNRTIKDYINDALKWRDENFLNLVNLR